MASYSPWAAPFLCAMAVVGLTGAGWANGPETDFPHVDPLTIAPPVPMPEGRRILGVTRIFDNDWYGIPVGDRYDRWQTGSFAVSILHGHEWQDALPERPFQLMEYRVRGQIIAPDNLAVPDPGDRPYASSWWLGAATHFGWQGFDVTAGADVVITGQQTGLMQLHSAVHEVFGNNPVRLEDYEIDDGIYLHGRLEVAREFEFDSWSARPFVEVQAGVETFARTGIDLTFGNLGANGLRLRDEVTGQRIAGLNSLEALGGWSFLLGGDVAYVTDSVFLPEDRGVEVEEMRHRLRAGVNYGVGDSNFFYGVTYLSEEFVNQPAGQVVGTLSIDLRF